MAITSDSIGLLFKAKGDTDDAQKAFRDFKKEIDAIEKAAKDAGTPMQQLGASAGLTAGQYKELAGNLQLAGGIFTAFGAIAVAQIAIAAKVVTGLFDLAKSASDAGSKIADMQQKTGLAASVLSTLKLAADNSGSSFEQVGDGITKFAKLLGQAQEGNEKAAASLKALGVTTTDLDGGLKQVIQTIAKATDGTEQITLAQKAFGKSGADLIPVIKQINGDLEAAEKEAKRLGVTLSEEDVRAADQFGDTLGLLSAQAATAAQRFALQFAPEITAAMASVSRFLAENQDVARVWGNTIADVMRTVSGVFSFGSTVITGALDVLGIKFSSSASQARFWAEAILLAINPVLALAARVGAMFGSPAKGSPQEFAQQAAASPIATPRLTGGGGSGGGGGGKSAADKAREEQERLDREAFQSRTAELRRMLANYEAVSNRIIAKANLDLAQGIIDETKFADLKMAVAERIGSYKLHLLEKELTAAQETNQKTADIESRIAVQKEANQALEFNNEAVQLKELNKLREENEKKYTDIVRNAIKVREGLEKKGVEEYRKSEKAKFDLAIKNKDEVLQNTIDVTKFLYESYQNDFENKKVIAAAERDRRLAEIEELKLDEVQKREAIAEINQTYDAEVVEAKRELNQKLAEVDEEYPIQVEGEEGAKGPFQDLIDGWTSFYETITATAPTIMETMQAVGGIMVKAFSSVANAIGNVVQQWVLYGKTGPAVMKQVLASALAAIAAEATVRAIYALAMGFFFLATHQYTDATNAFIAAAVFGSIGIGAALAGRAIAGNSGASSAVAQESSGAYGSAGSGANRPPGQGEGNDGGIYSSQEDLIVERDRNTPSIPVSLALKIQLDSNGVLEVIKDSVRSNGSMRDLILDAG